MQEESSSSMIAPLSDGNAHGMKSSTEETVVMDEPHAGATTGEGGSPVAAASTDRSRKFVGLQSPAACATLAGGDSGLNFENYDLFHA